MAPRLGLPRIYLEHIPKGYLGTQRTVAHIKALIRAGAKDFYVRQKAIDILLEKQVKPKDYLGEIKALFEWVQRNVRYTKDPFRVEVLHSARRMLSLLAGDCDDVSIFLGSMLEAIGHPVRLALTGPGPHRPRLFTHIYLEVFYKGRWIPLDPTMPYPMGWAPRALVKKVMLIKEGQYGVRGHGTAGYGRCRDCARLAARTHPGSAPRWPAAQRCASEVSLGPAAPTTIAEQEYVAAGDVALRLGPWPAGSAAPTYDTSAGAVAATLGDPSTAAGPPCWHRPNADSTFSAGHCAAGTALGRATSPAGECPAFGSGLPTALSKKEPKRPVRVGSNRFLRQFHGSVVRGRPRQGMALDQRFNQLKPSRFIIVRHPRLIPPVVVGLGELLGLIYRANKGQAGRAHAYIHLMEDPPRLVSNVEGTQLYVVGRNYRVTPRGIEG